MWGARRWAFGPIGVRCDREWLTRAEIAGCDYREDEVLGRYGIPREPPHECELASMTHRVRERALQKLFVRDARPVGRLRDDASEASDGGMEAFDLGGERRENRDVIRTPNEEGLGVAEHAVHVMKKLVRTANARRDTKGREGLGAAAERLLCAIRDRGEEMLEESGLVFHGEMVAGIRAGKAKE
jgi:hypothetical protein